MYQPFIMYLSSALFDCSYRGCILIMGWLYSHLDDMYNAHELSIDILCYFRLP